ncbi:hypothetical protein LTR01_003935 [Friedmanniomyces endolithicus]|nr:hypothetical protein LTR01_003935 [Friedmanniomyces endolithicus]KAK0832748.1 hypothetical protein LTR73_001833 [Friedmanniomyces endolithicus]
MPPKRRSRPSQLHPQPIVDSDPETDIPTEPLTLAPPPQRSNTELNLTVLRRYVPAISQIISIAPFAVLYVFSAESQQWEKCGIEGTLFVCQLEGPGRYSAMILNRKGLENFTTELLNADDVEITEDFVILQAMSEEGVPVIYGLWIFEDGGSEGITSTRKMVAQMIVSCAMQAQNAREAMAETNGDANGHEEEGEGYGMDGTTQMEQQMEEEEAVSQQAGQRLDLLQLFGSKSAESAAPAMPTPVHRPSASAQFSHSAAMAETGVLRSLHDPAMPQQQQSRPPQPTQRNALLGLFKNTEPFVIHAHIEEDHAECPTTSNIDAASAKHLSQSNLPQITAPPATEDDEQWTKCTRPRCGEYVLLSDIDEHLEMHVSLDILDAALSASHARSPKDGKSTAARQANVKESQTSRSDPHKPKTGRTLLEYFSGVSYHGRPPPQQSKRVAAALPLGRLGKRELGPHAFEKQMPDNVRRHLLNDALPHQVNRLDGNGKLAPETVVDNETSGIISMLARLCTEDKDVDATYLCHPSVKHVNKLRCDGNFCGYWNVQMMLSYLQTAGTLPGMRQTPNVLQIQDTIEQAWGNDILPHGRQETGGIRGTRKWIGTSEAAAYFTQLGVSVEACAFEDAGHELAAVALLDHIEAYFIGGLENADRRGTSHVTQLAPVYFQRLGHSMTIVGLQRNRDGSRELLVFDPSFETSVAMRTLLSGKRSRAQLENLLKPYRRSDQSLARWEEFEIVVPRSAGVA